MIHLGLSCRNCKIAARAVIIEVLELRILFAPLYLRLEKIAKSKSKKSKSPGKFVSLNQKRYVLELLKLIAQREQSLKFWCGESL